MARNDKGFEKPKIQKINEKTFPLIKQLVDAGVKSTEIQKMLGISSSTFYYAKNSESLRDYREKVNEIAKASLERRLAAKSQNEAPVNDGTEEKSERTVVAKPLTPDFTEVGLELIRDELREIKELLKSIAESKEVVTVEADEEPKRRSIFGFNTKSPF